MNAFAQMFSHPGGTQAAQPRAPRAVPNQPNPIMQADANRGTGIGVGHSTPGHESPFGSIIQMMAGIKPFDIGILSGLMNGGSTAGAQPQPAPPAQSQGGIAPFMWGASGAVPWQQRQQQAPSMSPIASPLQGLGMMAQASTDNLRSNPTNYFPAQGGGYSFNPLARFTSGGGLF